MIDDSNRPLRLTFTTLKSLIDELAPDAVGMKCYSGAHLVSWIWLPASLCSTSSMKA